MPKLNDATTPVHMMDAEVKALTHDRNADRIEELLKIRTLTDARREALQIELLRERRTAHTLRNPIQTTASPRMKSFVGTDMYSFNG